MRRLNETQSSYIESLKKLQIKCLLSNFNKKMVDDMINIDKTWLNRFKHDNIKTKDKNPQFHKIVWATSFTNCINLTDKEKHLNPLLTVIYKRPATLQNLLINHKKISLNLQPTNHKMDLLLLVVIVLFVVITEYIKTWSKTVVDIPI